MVFISSESLFGDSDEDNEETLVITAPKFRPGESVVYSSAGCSFSTTVVVRMYDPDTETWHYRLELLQRIFTEQELSSFGADTELADRLPDEGEINRYRIEDEA